MQAKPVLRWEIIFTPPILAALGSLVPSLLAAAWRMVAPSSNCTIGTSAFNSPCFAIVWVAALGLGWLTGAIVQRVGRGAAQGPMAADRARRRSGLARIVAGVAGLLLGIPLAGYVLNPCA